MNAPLFLVDISLAPSRGLASEAFVRFDSTSVALARARRVPTFPVERFPTQSNARVNSSIDRAGGGLARAGGGGDSVGSHTPPIETDRENTRQTDGRTDGP